MWDSGGQAPDYRPIEERPLERLPPLLPRTGFRGEFTEVLPEPLFIVPGALPLDLRMGKSIRGICRVSGPLGTTVESGMC